MTDEYNIKIESILIFTRKYDKKKRIAKLSEMRKIPNKWY